MRLNCIADSWESAWSIESQVLIKATNRLWRIGALTVVEIRISVKIWIDPWCKRKIAGTCSDVHSSMLLLLGFEVTMMAAIFGKQVYLMSLMILVVITLSIAVRLPSTCEI